jgi:alpha-L-fucosidase 2
MSNDPKHPFLSSHLLRSRRPAADFLEAFPLGNGRLGAMIPGVPEYERIALNHENLWRGKHRHQRVQAVPADRLAEIRAAIFSGDYARGHELCTRYLSGPPFDAGDLSGVQPYQPLADLHIEVPSAAGVTACERTLCLRQALSTLRYAEGEVCHTREMFISVPHQAMVVRLREENPGGLSCGLWLDRVADEECTVRRWAEGNRFGLSGRFVEGVGFAVEGRVLSHDGTLSVDDKGRRLRIDGAKEIVFAMTSAVDLDWPFPFSQPDPEDWCSCQLDSIAGLGFDELFRAHVEEYEPLYHRFQLELEGSPELEELPVEERQQRLRDGGSDPALFALHHNYARYLLLSSSRACDQPANLQGIWSEEVRPPWNCYFSTDINLGMNYWPAEAWGLPECVDPLFALLERHRDGAERAARDYYGCRGTHYFTGDIWQMHYMPAADWDIWTGTGAMMALHYWWRFEYSQDREVLRHKVYPFLKGMAAFYQDFLVRDPSGFLVACPTQSPENAFKGGGTTDTPSYCYGATMDTLLVREVLSHCLEASRLLGVDEDLRPGWERIVSELPPLRVGAQGQLQEWIEDFEELEPGHRHLSHLYGVFPGDSLRDETALQNAAKVSLKKRIEHGAGREGWSLAWAACLQTAFRDEHGAYESLRHLIADCSSASLLDLHPVTPWHSARYLRRRDRSREPACAFQIDGNFGGAAAMLELLAQSRHGRIDLLPVLPEQWSSGRVAGLRLRGGVELSMCWREGRLVEGHLQGKPGGKFQVRLPEGAYEACTGPSGSQKNVPFDGAAGIFWEAEQPLTIRFGEVLIGRTEL